MKTRTLIVIGILITASIFPLVGVDKAYADCNANVDYNLVLRESELAFTGTVTRLDNYDGPQKVTFFIHETIKGEIDTPKYVLENLGKIFYEDGSTEGSSVSVDYKIGKTYKVYVMSGQTSICTTKTTTPPADYMWQPGPEDGNYYSENPVWEDPCEEGYGMSNDVCITLEEINKDNPICGQNPKHDFGKCNRVYEEPENTLDYVLSYCNATGAVTDDERRWWNTTHYIDNNDCEFLDKVRGSQTYGQSIKNYEPIEPIISDEQLEMWEDYCLTGIRHSDMEGYPQCIKQVPECGKGAKVIDGICMITPVDKGDPIASKAFSLMFIGIVVLIFGIIGVAYFLIRRSWKD